MVKFHHPVKQTALNPVDNFLVIQQVLSRCQNNPGTFRLTQDIQFHEIKRQRTKQNQHIRVTFNLMQEVIH